MQLPPVVIGGWNCTCTVEESPANRVEVALHLRPRLDGVSEITGSYRSNVEVKLDLGDKGLQHPASVAGACGSVCGGRISVFARFDDVTLGDIRAVVAGFGGDTKRVAISGPV